MSASSSSAWIERETTLTFDGKNNIYFGDKIIIIIIIQQWILIWSTLRWHSAPSHAHARCAHNDGIQCALHLATIFIMRVNRMLPKISESEVLFPSFIPRSVVTVIKWSSLAECMFKMSPAVTSASRGFNCFINNEKKKPERMPKSFLLYTTKVCSEVWDSTRMRERGRHQNERFK